MRRAQLRLVAISSTMGLVFSLLIAGQALGAHRSFTTLYDTGGHPWQQVSNVWGSYAYFNGQFDAVKMQDAGRTWWDITKFETTGIVEYGNNCAVCLGWSFSTKVQFLNAAGTVLATYYPPIGTCYWHHSDPAWVVLYKCQSAYQISASATKVKYTFSMWASCDCFPALAQWGPVTKTVSL